MEKNKISDEWLKLFNTLSESQKRWAAAVKASEIGYGGISTISRATELSRTTITQGVKEINGDLNVEDQRIRKQGGGRKPKIAQNSNLTNDIEKILSETTAGDPMSTIKWTCKSVRNMANELGNKGHDVSYRTVHRLLIEMGYSLQSNRKSLSHENNPDRDKQFRMINRKVNKFLKEEFPVISVDTKKK